MMRSWVVPAAIVIALLAACSEDPPPSAPPATFGGASSSSGSNAASTVDCTHPGAGRSVGNDRCECSSTRNVAGEWSGARTCRESQTCPLNAADESLTFTQVGNAIRGESATYLLTGTLCDDFISWSGGPKDATYKECGQIRLTDDGHYVKDSCYAASGTCRSSFGMGCPSLTGQCTATGAKKPAAAPPIIKNLCL